MTATIVRRWCVACRKMRDHVNGRCCMNGSHPLAPCRCGHPTPGGVDCSACQETRP